MSSRGSLRERKKQRTQATLVEVSQRLFRTQGYEATTLERIADEAEVSVPTLLTYFDSKERLALAGEYAALDQFRAAISDPDREEDTLTIWRRHVLDAAATVMEDPKPYVRYQRFVSSTPVLLRRWLSLMRDYEDAIADGIAADYETDPSKDLATRLLATTLSFGVASTTRNWISNGGAGDLADLQLAVIDFAVESFPKPGGRFVASAGSDRGSSARGRRAADA